VLRETCDRAARDFATLILHAGADLPRRVPLRMTLRSRKTSTRAGR
jgi:hypothetical protein